MSLFLDWNYRLVQRLRGERVYEALEQIEKSQWYEPDKFARIQWQQLKTMISHAYENVPYYRHKFNLAALVPDQVRDRSDFRKVPILTKKDLREPSHSIKAQDQNYAFSSYSSSGSTGPSSMVLVDRTAAAFRHAAVFRMRKWMGLDIGDRMIMFWGSQLDVKNRSIDYVKDLFLNRRTFSTHALDNQQMEEYCRSVRRFKPKLLYGFTSAIYQFAQFLTSRNQDFRNSGIKAVLVTGEPLFEYQRECMEDTFGCPVYVQYGAEEFGPIAYECPDGGLHVMAENVYVEVEEPVDSAGKGNLLITSLRNSVMPLIRYRLGDVGMLSENKCSCGRGLPMLKEISGRSVDYIKTPDGKIMHGINFDYLPKYFLKEIKQFKIEQTDLNTLSIVMVKEKGFDEHTVSRFEKKLREIVGNKLQIHYEFKTEIPREATGKTRFVSTRLNS